MGVLEVWVGGVMGLFVLCYTLSGGGGLGGAFWDLVAAGDRYLEQRVLLRREFGPWWELHQGWLCLALLVLGVGFPGAFGAVFAVCWVPLLGVLFGLGARGALFWLRRDSYPGYGNLGRFVLALASVCPTFLLGMMAGALVSGELVERVPVPGATFFQVHIASWTTPFCAMTGCFVTSVFALLAAVSLAQKAEERGVQDDFRLRAAGAAMTVWVLGWACMVMASEGAPLLYKGLRESWWSLPLQTFVGLLGLGVFYALWHRRFAGAQRFAQGLAAVILCIWWLAQWPYLVVPQHTLQGAAAPRQTLWLLLPLVCLLGGLLGFGLWVSAAKHDTKKADA